jgi:hypothetical protein
MNAIMAASSPHPQSSFLAAVDILTANLLEKWGRSYFNRPRFPASEQVTKHKPAPDFGG